MWIRIFLSNYNGQNESLVGWSIIAKLCNAEPFG